MSIHEYSISFDIDSEAERIIRDFLLRNSNIVRFTEIHWTEGSIFKRKKCGGLQDENFRETLNTLQEFFIKTEINNKKYSDIEQGKHIYTHYFYTLSPQIKTLINDETLLWDRSPYCSNHFYGFEDVTFYYDNFMRGSVITHEPIIILFLTPEEKNQLQRSGIVFDASL